MRKNGRVVGFVGGDDLAVRVGTPEPRDRAADHEQRHGNHGAADQLYLAFCHGTSLKKTWRPSCSV